MITPTRISPWRGSLCRRSGTQFLSFLGIVGFARPTFVNCESVGHSRHSIGFLQCQKAFERELSIERLLCPIEIVVF